MPVLFVISSAKNCLLAKFCITAILVTSTNFRECKEMTNTQRRNGAKVEQAADRVCLTGQGINWLRCTVGQVAKEANVSKPTAQKYLEMLVEHGAYVEEERDMRYCVRNTPRVFRYAKMTV